MSYFASISAWIWPSPKAEKESSKIESEIEEAKPHEIEEAKPFEVKEAKPFEVKKVKSPENKKAKARDEATDIALMKCFRGAFLCFYFVVGLICSAIIWYGSKGAISRYFSGPRLPDTCTSGLNNLYYMGFPFDFHAFVSENNAPNFEPDAPPIWTKQNLTYYNDGVQSNFTFSTIVSIPEVSYFL